MKIKNDFITNSSSASFILTIDSTANSLDEFLELWNKFLEHFILENKWKIDIQIEKYKKNLEERISEKNKLLEKINSGNADEKDKTIFNLIYSHYDDDAINKLKNEDIQKMILGEMNYNHVISHVFSVEHNVSMYNSFDDIPDWMIYVIIKQNMGSDLFQFGIKDVIFSIEENGGY